jgi:hypothetical protein
VSLSVKCFAPKGVAQLAVLEEEALLLVLSDGQFGVCAAFRSSPPLRRARRASRAPEVSRA